MMAASTFFGPCDRRRRRSFCGRRGLHDNLRRWRRCNGVRYKYRGSGSAQATNQNGNRDIHRCGFHNINVRPRSCRGCAPRNFPFELCEGQPRHLREAAIEVVVLSCWAIAAGQSSLAPLCQPPAGIYQPPLQAGPRPSSDPRRQHQQL